jgi:hypothetical protein
MANWVERFFVSVQQIDEDAGDTSGSLFNPPGDDVCPVFFLGGRAP